MASLFSFDLAKPELSILDAGSGAGILSAAMVKHIREKGYPGNIHLVCYENDASIQALLERNLSLIASEYNIDYSLRNENYLTSQPFYAFDLFASEQPRYDLIIGNPPYKKIPKESIEANHMSTVCYGAPNLYFLFLAMGIHNLEENGELVYIIPRSWTSGAYFHKFRNYLFSKCIIERIHLFGSRDKVFKGESVLQETMIITLRKSLKKPKTIKVSFSETSDFSDIQTNLFPYHTIVNPNGYVFLVTNHDESKALERIGQQQCSLLSNNMRMQTGLIVDYRSQDVLRNAPGECTYPLFFSQHIKNGTIAWPIGRENEYICTERSTLLQDNTNYLFVKRFTAKEEKRRLQCGIYLAENYPQFRFISTQNKINYIKCGSKCEVYGLFALLNSSLYDTYYRVLNGSTQVNSTEVNDMPMPSRETIRQMGSELMTMELTEDNCDKIISKWIK